MHSVTCSALCNVLKICHKLRFVSRAPILVQAQLTHSEELSTVHVDKNKFKVFIFIEYLLLTKFELQTLFSPSVYGLSVKCARHKSTGEKRGQI